MEKKFKGLEELDVKASRYKYGSNVIIEDDPPTLWERIKDGFGDPMIRLLCVIAVIMLGLFIAGQGEWYEPVGILLAIVLVTVISAKTGMASDDAYRKLKDSTKKEEVRVYRGGELRTIDISEVVVGDIVLVQSGDKIPADGVLVHGELRVDNSALNGETEECKKVAIVDGSGFKIPDNITGETFVDKHSLFRGATVYNGEGLIEIQKVGMDTMMGKMASDMGDDEVASPLTVKLTDLAGKISKFGYIGAVVISLAYLLHFIIVAGGIGEYIGKGGVEVFKDVIEAVTLAITIVVCAVPEGLPLMIALVLMSNTGIMLKRNVLVRKPIGIETAGSLNILFSDKTGTITKGKLEVVKYIDGAGEELDISSGGKVKELTELCICKNTQAMYDNEHRIVGGNATDKALLAYIGEDKFNEVNKGYVIERQQGFNSTNKFSQSELRGVGETVYKGAPEVILSKAKRYIGVDGKERELDREKLDKVIDDLANKAMRVLAFGYSKSGMIEDKVQDDVVLVGLVGIRDDVRVEAVEAIKDVQDAGVQVVMITGDRKETALAIGKDAGLVTSEDDLVLTSAELNKMSDDEVKGIMGKLRVIARALPTDKSRMVRLCQEMNLVTAMTGDGRLCPVLQ